MPRTETVIQVFVASPSDLADERRALDEIISELNATWARTLAVRVDLWRWESNGYPGAGSDPQDVINAEAPHDYDIFIGIMWARFGTPTPRAGSGTEEEFRLAKARHDSNPSSIDVMFYFKDTPVSPSSLDVEQLGLVKSFRSSLGSEGILYWTFDSTDQFQNLVRVHLSQAFQRWQGREKRTASATEPSAAPAGPNPSVAADVPARSADSMDEDQGFLDLLESANSAMTRLTDTGTHIAETVTTLGGRISQRTVAMNSLDKTEPGYLQSVRRISAAVADDLDEFTGRIKVETPLYLESLRNWMESLSRAASVSLDFSNSAATLQSAASTVAMVRNTLRSSEAPTREFRNTIARTPRLTTTFNRSKRRAVEALDALLGAFAESDLALEKTEQTIKSLLPPDQPPPITH